MSRALSILLGCALWLACTSAQAQSAAPDRFVLESSRAAAPFSYDSIAYLGERHHTIVHTERSIDGFLVDKTGKWLVFVSVGARDYVGAGNPRTLGSVQLGIVDLKTVTLRTREVDLPSFSPDAIAIAIEGDRLLVNQRRGRLRKYRECKLTGECELREDLQPGEFPPDGYLDVTSSGAWRVDAVPDALRLPKQAIRRSVACSPNGSRVSYSTLEIKGKTDGEWTLWAARADGSDATLVVKATNPIEALWENDDALLFSDVTIEPASERISRWRADSKRAKPTGWSNHIRLYSQFRPANIRGGLIETASEQDAER